MALNLPKRKEKICIMLPFKNVYYYYYNIYVIIIWIFCTGKYHSHPAKNRIYYKQMTSSLILCSYFAAIIPKANYLSVFYIYNILLTKCQKESQCVLCVNDADCRNVICIHTTFTDEMRSGPKHIWTLKLHLKMYECFCVR